MDLLKVPRFSCQKRLQRHLTLAVEGLKSSTASVSNRLSVTVRKSSNNWNLEPKGDLIIFLFFKVTLKVTVVNSKS